MFTASSQGSAAVSTPDANNIKEEFSALLSSSGAYQPQRAKIVLTGGDRVRWLNGMVTNNIRDLSPGHGVYSFLLNPQGHIQADFYAYNRGNSLLIDVDLALKEKVLGIFDHYIIMDDVEVNDVTDKLTTISIAGPGARATLQAAGITVQEIEPLQLVELAWRGVDITLVRADNPLVESYEIWVAPGSASTFWEALVSAGAKRVSAGAVELLRIASGNPRYGQDIRERDLPQETEQQRALHFSKGCYVGQEIVERIRSRGAVHRKFTGFEVEGPLPAAGTKIQAGGKDVGEITSTAFLPLPNTEHGRGVALGYIRREAAKPDQALVAGDSKFKIADLPFRFVITANGS